MLFIERWLYQMWYHLNKAGQFSTLLQRRQQTIGLPLELQREEGGAVIPRLRLSVPINAMITDYRDFRIERDRGWEEHGKRDRKVKKGKDKERSLTLKTEQFPLVWVATWHIFTLKYKCVRGKLLKEQQPKKKEHFTSYIYIIL